MKELKEGSLKRILFVCVENSCRSQMAEGFARSLGSKVIEAYSAGSHPSGTVNPRAIEVMKEVGIDLSGFRSKGFPDLPIPSFDYAVTLGCRDACPLVPAQRHIEWRIEDPKGKDIASFRTVRDAIRRHVEQLVVSLADNEL